MRQRPLLDALADLKQPITALAAVFIAFQRRGCRTQDDWAAREFAAHDGDISAVVAQPVFLFVGRVVFLVDYDQSKLRDWREDRRAGADDDIDIAAQNMPPLGPTFRRGQGAVQHANFSREAPVDAIQ